MPKKIILLLSLALILSVAAFALWRMDRGSAPVVTPEPVPEEVSETPNESESIDTSDWKTYRNEEYGFEVKYPKEWGEPEPFKEVGGNQRTFIYQGGYFEGCCQGVRVEIVEGLAQNVYERKINNLDQGDLLNQRTDSIGNIKVQEIVYDTHYGKNERISFIPVGSFTIELGRAHDDSIAEAVIGTFQLIK